MFQALVCGIAVVSIVFGAQSTNDWKTYFGATKEQQQKLDTANKAKSTTAKALRDQEDATIEQLRQKVEANAPDADLTTIFNTVKSTTKSIQKAENDFWDTIEGFLSPTQVAKLFLKSHPPKNQTASTAAPANTAKPQTPSVVKPATPAQDWKSYFAATKEQQQKLDTVNKTKNEKVKSLREQKDNQIEQLRQKVDAAAPDNDIQTAFAAVRSSDKAIQDAENGYWDTVAGFLTQTEQAKLFLRGHPKK